MTADISNNQKFMLLTLFIYLFICLIFYFSASFNLSIILITHLLRISGYYIISNDIILAFYLKNERKKKKIYVMLIS